MLKMVACKKRMVTSGVVLSSTCSHSQGILDEPHCFWHQCPNVKGIGNVSS